jgi:type II secretory pathway component PulF
MQQLLKEKEEAQAAVKLLKDKELLLVEKEQKRIDERNILQHELDNASKMLDEGNSRLEVAVATKNFGDIEVAQLLIGGANKKLDALKTQLNDNSEQMNQLRKKVKK